MPSTYARQCLLRPCTSSCLLCPSPNLRHQQPANPLSTEECDHGGLDNPDTLFSAHYPDHKRPERTPALAYGTHERERVCMHVSRDELSAGGNRRGIKCGNGDADESGTDCGGGGIREKPCGALEAGGEGEVDDDGAALAEEHVEWWKEDASESEA